MTTWFLQFEDDSEPYEFDSEEEAIAFGEEDGAPFWVWSEEEDRLNS